MSLISPNLRKENSLKQSIEGKITSLLSSGSRNSSPSRRQQQPKSVDALGLEQAAPRVPESLAQEFIAYTEEKKPEKKEEIEGFKRFSVEMEKVCFY